MVAGEVPKQDVIAFRLRAHHLLDRVPGDELEVAAGACGVQNSPPGSALLALHARVGDMTAETLESAVAQRTSLLLSWCMRGAPFFFPTGDAPVFTTGVLPQTEAAMRSFLPGVVPAVDLLGISLRETVDRCGAAVAERLAGRRLTISELGAEVAEDVGATLSPDQRVAWLAPGPYAPGQPLGEAVVHFCVRLLTLQGLVCLAAREGNRAPFVLLREWLDGPLPILDVDAARAELLRRYLHCYGPSTRADFATWTGLGVADTTAYWELLRDEVTPVPFNGTTWLLAADADILRAPARPAGVRYLPPGDPYTQLRDRETIVDPCYRSQVWKAVGAPGTVLVRGRIAGTWRPRRSGRKLTLAVTTFTTLPERDREALRAEAAQVATLRGANTVAVEFRAR